MHWNWINGWHLNGTVNPFNFLGNHKSPAYVDGVQSLLNIYQKLGCHMSLKILVQLAINKVKDFTKTSSLLIKNYQGLVSRLLVDSRSSVQSEILFRALLMDNMDGVALMW